MSTTNLSSAEWRDPTNCPSPYSFREFYPRNSPALKPTQLADHGDRGDHSDSGYGVFGAVDCTYAVKSSLIHCLLKFDVNCGLIVIVRIEFSYACCAPRKRESFGP